MKLLGLIFLLLNVLYMVHGRQLKVEQLQFVSNQPPIQWTKPGEINNMFNLDGKPFRDTALESILNKILQKYLTKDKLPSLLKFSDPLHLTEGFDVDEDNQLLNVNFKAKNIAVSGLSAIKVDYLRVIRHFGLNDIKIMATLSTDITITGDYYLKGTALVGLLPVNGEGKFNITIHNCKISGVILVAATNDAQLLVQDIDVGIGYEKQDLNFENLMGGGVAGRTAHTLMSTMGKIAFDNNMNKLKQYVREGYRNLIEFIF